MDKTTPLTPFEEQLQMVLSVPEPRSEFAGQMQTLLRQSRAPRRVVFSPWMILRWAAPAAAVLVLLLAFLIVGPDRVMAAVRNWLNHYVPGVGFVDNTQDLRFFTGPLLLERDGASLVVERGYASSSETAIQIRYQEDPRSCADTSQNMKENLAAFSQAAYILLPDGHKLAAESRFAQWGRFPPLPQGVNEVLLVLPSNIHYPCTAVDGHHTGVCQCLAESQRWLVPLKFHPPAPGDVLPVIDSIEATPKVETPTPTPVENNLAAGESTPVTLSEPQPQFEGKLVDLPDGYLFVIGLKRPENNNPISYSFGMNAHHAKLVDGAGNEIELVEVDPSQLSSEIPSESGWIERVLFRTQTKTLQGPVKLWLEDIVRGQTDFGPQAEFEVDLGTAMAADTHYPQDIPFDIIPGHPFRLREIWVAGRYDQTWDTIFSFEGVGFETIVVDYPEAPSMGGSSSLCEDFENCFYNENSLPLRPDGHYHLVIREATVHISGAWELTFELP